MSNRNTAEGCTSEDGSHRLPKSVDVGEAQPGETPGPGATVDFDLNVKDNTGPEDRSPGTFEWSNAKTGSQAAKIAEARTLGAPDVTDAKTLPVNAKLPNIPGYQVTGELARGAMGVVYKAQQLGLGRWVALKMVLAGAHASESDLKRFQGEARAVAALQHANIVQIYEINQHEGLPYFSMEYVEGGTLLQKTHRQPQPPRDAAFWIETLARAMAYSHQHGVIHRDLKPGNILISSGGVLKITDFGLAKRLGAADSNQTREGAVIGTPSYMAPEQAGGGSQSVGPSADVYALGAILYELLTGRPPFLAASATQTILQVLSEEPMAPTRLQPHLSTDLVTICMKCLQKEPVKRYQGAEALAEDVRRFLAGEPILARPVSQMERAWRWCKRKPAVAALSASVFVLLLAVAISSTVSYFRIKEEKAEVERQSSRAKIARGEADTQKEAAQKAEKVASTVGKLAVNNLYVWVTEVEEKLRDRPDLANLRQELVSTGMDGLKKIDGLAKDAGTVGQAFRTMGVAHQRMGDILEGKGKTEEAFSKYQLSLEYFERLGKEEPNNDWIPWNFAVSYDKLGAMSQEFHGDAAAARDYFRKSLALRQSLAAKIRTPEIPASRRGIALSVSYIKLADLSRTLGEPVEARDFAAKALQEADKLLAADPPVAAASQFRSMAIYLLGRISAHLKNEVPASRKYFQESLDMRQKAVGADSNNAASRRELGAVYDSLGDLELEQHNASEALKYYRRAFEQYEWLNKKDANSAYDQWFLGHSYYRQGCAKLELADSKGAALDFSQALQLREILAKNDPKSLQMKAELMLVQARCGLSVQAAEAAEDVRKRAPKNPGVLYTAACGFALCLPAIASGKDPQSPENQALRDRCVKSAVETLEQAIKLGYRDVEALRLDPDLAPMREFPAFQKLIRQLDTNQ